MNQKFVSVDTKNFGTPLVIFPSVDPKTKQYLIAVIGASNPKFPFPGHSERRSTEETRQEALIRIPGNRKKRRLLRKLINFSTALRMREY
jgi:hypothetical protein